MQPRGDHGDHGGRSTSGVAAIVVCIVHIGIADMLAVHMNREYQGGTDRHGHNPIARKWHIRVHVCARAKSLPATQYMEKKRKREGKRPKADRLKIQSGSSVVHTCKNHFLPRPLLRKKQALLAFIKTIFCPDHCSERNSQALRPPTPPGPRPATRRPILDVGTRANKIQTTKT